MTCLHCRSCSQPRAVWNRHKTLSLAERATGEEGEASQARKPYYLLSATQAEPANMRWLFMCSTMIIILKQWWNQSECQRKGKKFTTKAEKAKPQQWRTGNISMLAKDLKKKAEHHVERRNLLYSVCSKTFWICGQKIFTLMQNFTNSNTNLTNSRVKCRDVGSENSDQQTETWRCRLRESKRKIA